MRWFGFVLLFTGCASPEASQGVVTLEGPGLVSGERIPGGPGDTVTTDSGGLDGNGYYPGAGEEPEEPEEIDEPVVPNGGNEAPAGEWSAWIAGQMPGSPVFDGVSADVYASEGGMTVLDVDLLGEHGWAMVRLTLGGPLVDGAVFEGLAGDGIWAGDGGADMVGCAGPTLNNWSYFDGHDDGVVAEVVEEDDGTTIVVFGGNFGGQFVEGEFVRR